jgi:hypothetical protein
LLIDSSIDAATIQAYLETEYRIDGDTPAILKVGTVCPELAALHKSNHTDCSAFVTACNPFSQAMDEASNASRQRALLQELRRRGLTFEEGIGQHPSNQWPGEPSFLVFGLGLEDAKELGASLEQNAIVWSGSDALPQLILLR